MKVTRVNRCCIHHPFDTNKPGEARLMTLEADSRNSGCE